MKKAFVLLLCLCFIQTTVKAMSLGEDALFSDGTGTGTVLKDSEAVFGDGGSNEAGELFGDDMEEEAVSEGIFSDGVSLSDESGSTGGNEEEENVEVWYGINPEYVDIYDVSDLNPEVDYAIFDYEDWTYCDTVDEAAIVVRQGMVQREKEIAFGFKAENYSSEEFNGIVSKAVSHTGNPREGDYLRRNYLGWTTTVKSAKVDGETYYQFLLKCHFFTTLSQENSVDSKLSQLLNNSSLRQANDYEKVKYVYDYICRHVTYDYDNLEDDSYELKYSTYAALINGTAVCQGYATLFYRMCLELGVDARYINGYQTSTGGNHGWNIVKLGNSYYNLDSTWDAGRTSYSYFLKSNSNFLNHTRRDEYNTTEFNSTYSMSSSDYGGAEAVTYTISYNANGGSNAPTDQNKSNGTNITLSSVIPERFGYNFIGWSASATASSVEYLPGEIYNLDSSVILKAVWEKATEISGTLPVNTNVPITIKGTKKYLKFTPTATKKYSFSSTGEYDTYLTLYDYRQNRLAYDDDSGEKRNFLLEYTLTAGMTYYLETKLYSDSIVGTYSLSVYNNTYTIQYDGNGGTNIPSEQTKEAGIGVTLSNTVPKRFGYSFQGWSTSASDAAAEYLPGSTFERDASVTLYAVWTSAQQIGASLPETMEVNITVAGAGRFFKLVPASSGTYEFESAGTEDTYVTLYDSSGNNLKSNDDGGDSRNFLLSESLTSGSVYYIEARMYSSSRTGSFQMTVRKKTVLTITSQPTNKYIEAGSNAVFTVEAEGDGLSYQWQSCANGSSTWINSGMNGNKTASLTVPVTIGRNGYKYRCVIKDERGNTTTSREASLSVFGLKTQPASKYVAAGTNVVFAVQAIGNNVSYQWQACVSGSSTWINSGMSGNKTASLTVPVTTARNGYKYRCVIKEGSEKSVTSDVATLSVFGITQQPSGKTAMVGSNVVFTVKAIGNNLKYQWQACVSSSAWTNSGMSGNKTASLTVPVTIGRNGYKYRCVITDGSEKKVVSGTAVLSVFGITQQPSGKSVTAGSNAVFNVKAIGANLSYQWQARVSESSNWVNTAMTGNKTETLTVPATLGRNGYKYRCIITDGKGNKFTSNAALLTVKAAELRITTQPQNKYIAAGRSTIFTVKASGSEISYQWQACVNGSSTWTDSKMTGCKTANLTVSAATSRNGYKYRCVITDGTGKKIISASATLTVFGIDVQPSGKSVTAGTEVEFAVKAIGKNLSYIWMASSDGGVNWKVSSMKGAQTAKISVPATKARNGYKYRCLIMDAEGNIVTSSTVILTVK